MYELSHVNKYFNGRGANSIHVINDVSLSLPDTGLFAIFGISGCGKTTLLNVLGGIDSFSGTITVGGKELTSATSDEIRNRDIGFIFQNYNLDAGKTVIENVIMALNLAGLNDAEECRSRAIYALKAVGMDMYANRFPRSLSGGQQQRVAIARAIVKSPKVILADEPTGNLDETNTVQVMEMLKELSLTRLVLLVTHEEELVSRYCDTVIHISDGSIVECRENNISEFAGSHDGRTLFLGDMEKKSASDGDTVIEMFSDGSDVKTSPKIRIIRANGKTYIQCNDPTVAVINDKSEIKVVDSTRAETEKARKTEKPDISELKPVNGKKVGSAFGFFKSIAEGYRYNFKGAKFGKKLLIAALLMFSISFVMNVASFGTDIYTYQTASLGYSDNAFYVKPETAEQLSTVLDAVSADAEAHIIYNNYAYYYSSSSSFSNQAEFTVSGFETKSFNTVYVNTAQSTYKMARKLKTLKGSIPADASNGVVITSALADYLLTRTDFSLFENYDSIMLLSCNGTKISAIVESDDICIFMNADSFVASGLESNYGVYVSSLLEGGDEKLEIEKGTAYVAVSDGNDSYGDKETVTICGKEFSIAGKVYCFRVNYGKIEVYADKEGTVFLGAFSSDSWWINAIVCKEDATELSLLSGNGKSYISVYSYDIDSDIEKVKAVYDGEIYTPDYFADEAFAENQAVYIADAVSLAIDILALIVCLYFIMRSGMMVRIKEIGIYRVIGASKKNVIFKFFAETVLVSALTVLPGYIFASVSIAVICSFSSVFTAIAYYPLWLAIITFIVLHGFCLLTGIAPVARLLRKTPAQIMATYDI